MLIFVQLVSSCFFGLKLNLVAGCGFKRSKNVLKGPKGLKSPLSTKNICHFFIYFIPASNQKCLKHFFLFCYWRQGRDSDTRERGDVTSRFLRSYFPSFSLFRAGLVGDEIGKQKSNQQLALWEGIAWRVLA